MKWLVAACLLVASGTAVAAEEGGAYLAVGEAESRAGHWQTAATALERAVRLLPSSARAAAALGVAYARLGRLDQAREQLARALGLGDARATTQLELGMVDFRLGRCERALPRLRAIRERADAPELRDAARFFEALCALKSGEGVAAWATLADIERTGGSLALEARRLTRALPAPARLAMSLTLRGDYDTNALLLPGTPSAIALPSPEADAALFTSAGLRGRPARGVDLVLRDDVIFRKQATIRELDLLGNVLGLDYRGVFGASALTAGYQFDTYWLASSLYLLAHRFGAGYERQLTGRARLAASAALLLRRFQDRTYDPFSGESVLGRMSAVFWGPPALVTLETGYAPSYERTREPDLGFQGHGFFFSLTWRAAPRLTVAAGAELALRWYLAPDEVLGETRRETQPLGWLSLTFQAARGIRIVLNASYTRNLATPDFYAYDRFIVSLATALDFTVL